MDLQAYLNRINMANHSRPSVYLLNQLQTNHIQSIPWENLDIYYKKPVSLQLGVIIKKFITEQRGGICFELNGAYLQLLTDLGYKPKLVSARIFGFNDKKYAKPRDTHMVILIELENNVYLTDVAWDGFRNALPLTGERVTTVAGTHRVYRDHHDQYYLQKMIAGTWYTQYQFFDHAIQLNDLYPHLDYSNADAEREAAHHLIFFKYTNKGAISLIDNKMTIDENGIIKKYCLNMLDKNIFVDLFCVCPIAFDRLIQQQ